MRYDLRLESEMVDREQVTQTRRGIEVNKRELERQATKMRNPSFKKQQQQKQIAAYNKFEKLRTETEKLIKKANKEEELIVKKTIKTLHEQISFSIKDLKKEHTYANIIMVFQSSISQADDCTDEIIHKVLDEYGDNEEENTESE